mmetsp:Transcript_40202/g.94142  ORF Transcript_40202/g.94142 Transcript_40202/m.94142 type:complete len:214 (-) Transcript_40202:1910-2551(-)
MNSMTMPPNLSITSDMSLKYRLSKSSVCSGSSFSTILVNEAISEKKSVTSRSSILGRTSSPATRRFCTTGHGTYFPQDRIATFVFEKMCQMRRTSAAPRIPLSVVTAASCSWAMLCISSARVRSGSKRRLESFPRSVVIVNIPTRMIRITVQLIMSEFTASRSFSERMLKITTADTKGLMSSCGEIVDWSMPGSQLRYHIKSSTLCTGLRRKA